MWVSGRKTESPNAALGFSTCLSCQLRKREKKPQSAESLGLCVRSAFRSAVSQLRGVQYDTLGGERASKQGEEKYTERDRMGGKHTVPQILTHAKTLNDESEGCCWWLSSSAELLPVTGRLLPLFLLDV